MRYLFLLPALAAFAVLPGCINASYAEHADMAKVSSLAGFDRVDASAGVRIVLSQGPFAVKAESPGNDFSRLILHVSGDTLVASRDTNWFDGMGSPEYTITVSAPSYKAFEVSSGARMDGAGLQASELKVSVSSGAHVVLAGNCAGLKADVSSGARFDGEGLRCGDARVEASSGAHAEAFASGSADGDASSGGSITFHGQPKSIEKETSSGGSVQAL